MRWWDRLGAATLHKQSKSKREDCALQDSNLSINQSAYPSDARTVLHLDNTASTAILEGQNKDDKAQTICQMRTLLRVALLRTKSGVAEPESSDPKCHSLFVLRGTYCYYITGIEEKRNDAHSRCQDYTHGSKVLQYSLKRARKILLQTGELLCGLTTERYNNEVKDMIVAFRDGSEFSA